MPNKEYKIVAYFSKVYSPRSYKRKIVSSYDEAVSLLAEAKDYYDRYSYLEDVRIEEREVTDWRITKAR